MPGQIIRRAEFHAQPDLIPGMRPVLGIGILFFQHMDHRLFLIENRRQKALIAVLPGERFPLSIELIQPGGLVLNTILT